MINGIQKLNKEKDSSLKKYGINIDPSQIQEKINTLEKKVEIEVDFEKEKKYMDEIRKLKKLFGDSSEVMKIASKADELAKTIKESRSKADEIHKKIQELSKDSDYNSFLALSAKITELKKAQEDAFQKFIEHKNKYNELYSFAKPKMERLDMLKMVYRKEKVVHQVSEQKVVAHSVEKRSEAVEQKLKSCKRITTEDFLNIQGDIAD